MSHEDLNEDKNIGEIVRFPLPDDSHVLTFDLERPNLRGRIVRLGRVLDNILVPHQYPVLVESILTETLTLAVLLSSMLKYEGIFILQTQSDGPVSRLVSDVTSSGDVRATASFDAEKLAALIKENPEPEMKDLLGAGYLAFTVDQGEHMERYQGIVALQGRNLQDSIHHYFGQSEQIGTAIKLAVGRDDAGKWRSGAIMLQHMPDHSNIPQDAKPVLEDWNRGQILVATCRDDELLDPKLHDETLLLRLFHEEGIRVFKPLPINKGCRCTQEKLKDVLSILSNDDVDHATVDGKIVMRCEFCSKDFNFEPSELKK